MVDYASTQAQTKGVAPSASREGSQAEAAVAKPLNASSPPLMGWIGCTINWWRSTQSPPRNKRSAPACASLTQLLDWFGPKPIWRGPPQQGWHRRHQLTAHFGPCSGNRTVTWNPSLTDRIAKGGIHVTQKLRVEPTLGQARQHF
jgi:hypothetical protein